MTSARQRLGKHILEITLSAIKGRLKAEILKSESLKAFVGKRFGERFSDGPLPWN
jgi:hypothetical protein